jgi:hypothetical protein
MENEMQRIKREFYRVIVQKRKSLPFRVDPFDMFKVF